MTKLYPIGTQLITRRLSQAALYYEIFGAGDLETRYSDAPGSMAWKYGFDLNHKHWSRWRVTVSEEEQKWLSPVPIVGDLMCIYSSFDSRDAQYGRVALGAGNRLIVECFPFEHNEWLWLRDDMVIEKRTYPNGQKAPLIEWDEVILPEQKG